MIIQNNAGNLNQCHFVLLTKYFGTFLSPKSVLAVVFACRKLSSSLNQKTLGMYGSLPSIRAVWIFFNSWQYVDRMFLILFFTSKTVNPGISIAATSLSYASSLAALFLYAGELKSHKHWLSRQFRMKCRTISLSNVGREAILASE